VNIDPNRLHGFTPGCIPIRAQDPATKRWNTYEIINLDKKSLKEWLQDRPKEYVDDVLGVILGHGRLHEVEDEDGSD